MMRDSIGKGRPVRWLLPCHWLARCLSARCLSTRCLSTLWIFLACCVAWTVPVARAQVRDDSSAEDPASLLAQPFETARQMLKLLNISDSDWRSFRDGQDLVPDDHEAAIKILFRLPQVGNQDVVRWSQPLTSWEPLLRDPESHRGAFFSLRGRVRSVKRVELSQQLVTLFGFDHYDVVEIQCADPPGIVIALTRTTPAAWTGPATLDEPVELSGMFLKVAAPRANGTAYLFAAPHIRWLPDRPNDSLKMGPDQVWLASQGWDVSLLETVATRNRLPLGGEERDGFYELLSIAGRIPASEWAARAQDVPLVRMLQNPEQVQGQIVRCAGKLRKVTKVLVPDADIQQMYGIRFYYQLDVLLPVGDQAIAFRTEGTDQDSTGPVYRSVFPVTGCTLTIPEEWHAWVDAPHVSQLVEFEGIFLKLWSYPNSLVTSLDVDQRQFSPLLITGMPRRAAAMEAPETSGGMLVVLALLGVLTVIWTGVSWLNRRDRGPRSRPGGTSRGNESPPDFAHLQNRLSNEPEDTPEP